MKLQRYKCAGILATTFSLFILSSGDVYGQFGGQFGAAVDIQDNTIYVMKPSNPFSGIAGIYAFEQQDDQAWSLRETLYTEGAKDRGLALMPSFSVVNNQLVVGAADPGLRWGAHVLTQQNGSWATQETLVFDASEEEVKESISLMDFARIVQPPFRSVALSVDRLAIGVIAGPSPLSGVHLYQNDGDSWKPEAVLKPEEPASSMQFGRHVVFHPSGILIGAPTGASGRGSVYVYDRNDEGGWEEIALLTAGDLASSAALGSSILVHAAYAFVGAPGSQNTAGTVLVFKEDSSDGAWKEVHRFSAPETTQGDYFGASIAAVGGEIWVGAPGKDQASGTVYRMSWDPEEQSTQELGVLKTEELQPAWLFGASIAGTNETAVVGAPGAFSADGRAAVFAQGPNGTWELEGWLRDTPYVDAITGSEIPCQSGLAGAYECENVDLLSFLPIDQIGGAPGEWVTDLWGWTDPQTSREYALVGRTGGAAIIDVTNPTLPVYLGYVPANPTNVRDLKVYKDHLFFVGDIAGDHGLVIFDLTRLRDVAPPPLELPADTVYRGIASAHNLIIDTESGFAYPVSVSGGGETCGGGLHMVDIREPLQPTFAGCFVDDTQGLIASGRTHDGQCVIYNGPDERFQGRQICFASNEGALRIVDVTDKENPKPIAAATYPRLAYTHQGWLTENHRYLYVNDELDELVGMTDRTRTLIWDVSELDDPVLVGEHRGSSAATDHNLYVKDNRMYQANYESGLHVFDISDPTRPVEVGRFDTTPGVANPPGFSGAFSAYPFFDSGTVIVSSIGEGLFVVRPSVNEQVP